MLTSAYPVQSSDWSRHQKTNSLWILFLTGLVLGLLGLQWYIGARLSGVIVTLAHASIDIKYQTASFHLALEELILGKQDVPKDKVWNYLEEAIWHVQAMLHGGTNEDGSFYPITSPTTRLILTQTLADMQQLDGLARSRLEKFAGVGSVADSEFNHLYQEVIAATEQVQQAIEQEITLLERQYRFVGLGFGGLLLGLALVAWLVLNVKEAHRRESEQRLLLQDTAMKAAANTIVITDAQGNIQWANQAFTLSTGYAMEEAIGQNPRILKSGQQNAAFYNKLWSTILAGQVWRGVFINKCKDGRLVHEEATITPMVDAKGRIVNFIAIKQDITQRVLGEKELQEAKRKAEAANQAKSDFLATMSHEIRTPLNVVLGILELLKESDLERSYQEQIQLAQGSGKMLLYLINDILDYSKIEANQLELDTIHFNLRTLLDDIAVSMASLAHVKHIELTGHFPDQAPVAVCGDPNRLRQVFTNLISNAIKFTPKGGCVEFHGGPVSREGDNIEFLFEIRDTGIGIPIQERKHVFERFVQANTSNTRQYGGTGLGLAICQRLVHLMNGTIGVDSNPWVESGSIFHFTVQLREQSSQPSPTVRRSALSGLRVLIVGSHGIQLAMPRNILQAWGLACDDAGELRTALSEMDHATTAGRPYQVVIVNQWPGQNRPPELTELGASDPGCRFLFLIDRLDQGMDQVMEFPGDTLCLKKPFSADQFHATLSTLLHLDPKTPPKSAVTLIHEARPAYHTAAILLVDDQTGNLIVTMGMLAKIGLDRGRCMTAMDGQQAVDRFQQNAFDLVFMDCQMPVMDGYQATRLIREWEQQQGRTPIPIIALTADVTMANRRLGETVGMNDFLAKPASMTDLRLMLDRHLTLVATPLAPSMPSQAFPVASASSAVPSVITSLEALGLEAAEIPSMVQLIIAQFPELLHTLERDLRAARYDEVRATAHVIRGSTINSLFAEIQHLTRALHDAVRHQAWPEALQQLTKVRSAFAPIHEALNTWLATVNPPPE